MEACEAIERETDEKRAGRDERRAVCMEENEVKQALALLKGALKKHPGAFALGAGTSAVRVFANVFALSAVSDASAEFHEQVHSVLYALMSVASKSDLVGMHELCKGCVELASDSKKVLELFPGKRYGGEFGAADDDFEDEASRETIVLCCFDTALAHVKRSEETSGRNGEAGTNGLSSSTSTGLMIEVQSLECAMNVTNTACKLLECALLTNPQNVAPLTTSELLFTLSRLLVIGSRDVQLSAAAVLKNLIADIPIVLVPCDTILAAIATLLTGRSLRRDDKVILELVYALKELAGEDVLRKHVNVLATSILTAIESARDESVRAVLFDVLRMCLLMRPSLAIQAITLLPHAVATKGSDALVECLAMAFSNAREQDVDDEDEVEKRSRLNEGEGEDVHTVTFDYDTRSEWIESCIVTSMEFLGGPDSAYAREGGGSQLQRADSMELENSLRDSAPSEYQRILAISVIVRSIAASTGSMRIRRIAAQVTYKWLGWIRAYDGDASDAPTTRMYALLAEAANCLVNVQTDKENKAPPLLSTKDISLDILTWPWTSIAKRDPSALLDDETIEGDRMAKLAALNLAVSLASSETSGEKVSSEAARQVLTRAFADQDAGVRSSAAIAVSFVHVLASNPPSGIGALQRLSSLKDAKEISVRNAFATALGGLAAAGVLHGIQKAAGNEAIRNAARLHGNRAVTAAFKTCSHELGSDEAKNAMKLLADSMQAFHEVVKREVIKAVHSIDGDDVAAGAPKTPGKFNRNKRRLTAGTPNANRQRSDAQKAPSLNAALTLQDLNSAGQLEGVILDRADPDGLVAASGLRSLRYAFEIFSAAGDFTEDGETLKGASALAQAALRTAHHKSPHVREALCEAASAIVSDDILLEMAPPKNERPEDRRRSSSAALLHAEAVVNAQLTSGLQILRNLKESIDTAPDSFIKESTLRTFAAVAETLTIPGATSAAVIVYFKNIIDMDLTAQNCAIYLLRRLAKKRQVRTRELLFGVQDVAAQIGTLLPLHEHSIATLAELAKMSPRQLLEEILPLSMMRLIRTAIGAGSEKQEDLSILQAYAHLLNKDLHQLVADYSYEAIAELINPRTLKPLSEQESNAFKSFLQKYSKDDLLTLISNQKFYIMKALITRAGAAMKDEQEDMITSAATMMTVFKALADAAQSDAHEVSDFFRPHFTRMEMVLFDKSGDTLSHKRYIRSLTIMVWIIGKHLPQFAPKVMAHLAHALNNPELRRTALQSWKILVQVLSERPAHLQRAADQIVVAMLPYLDANAQKDDEHGSDKIAQARALEDANQAAAVIDELVLRRGDVMRGNLARLPMLPDVQRLEASNARIAQERGLVSLRQLLGSLTESLADESLAVRTTALTEIRRRVSNPDNGMEIQGLIQGVEGTAADPIMSALVAALLKCCEGEGSSEASRRVQRAAAQCLSELGAIDPGRLLIASQQVQALNSESITVASILLVDHLARTVRGANDSDMLDAAAYAVQCVLIHVGCRPESVDEDDAVGLELPKGHSADGIEFWESLPDEARVVLAPCLTSMYSISGMSKESNVKQRPLYGSPTAGTTFNKWIVFWCRTLALEASGENAPLFKAAVSVFRHDIRIALFLLPYMVLDAILDNEERKNEVYLEIVAALTDAAGGDRASEDQNFSGSSTSHGRTELAAQTIFSLLDQLKGWADAQQDASGVNPVHSLMRDLSFTLLAKAAQRCGASARSLMYFEDYLRSNKMVLNQATCVKQHDIMDVDVSFLATIYQGLAEPDALVSIPRLRATPQPEDQLLQHEEAGEWEEALVHYESALQRGEEPMNNLGISVAEWGRLRCLQGLGHLRTVQREVENLIRTRPDAPPTLAEAGAAAAWRLGQWDDLDSLLGKIDSENSSHVNSGMKRSHRQMHVAPSALTPSGMPLTVGVGTQLNADVPQLSADAAIGRVLLALHKNDGHAFQVACASARDALITPLRAASMEGSYLRAHAALVQLHLLQEAESSYNAVVLTEEARKAAAAAKTRIPTDSSDIPLCAVKEFQFWHDRLDRTPPNVATREPILAFRRTIYKLLGAKLAASKTWLEQAKVARSAGHYGAAQLALLEARSEIGMSLPLALEQAKLLWAGDSHQRAVLEIEEALKDQDAVAAHPEHAAKAVLRLARWATVTGQKQKKEILTLYASVIKSHKSWEKSHFHVARYMDEWMKDATKRELNGEIGANLPASVRRKGIGGDDEEAIDLLSETVREYGASIKYGHRHIYESLPRMLTLWFDIGDRVYEAEAEGMENRNSAKLKKVFAEVLFAINTFSDQLPLYKWLTALPQLTSRLAHNDRKVRELVQTLVTRLLINYSDQVLWALVPMARSRDAVRAKSAKDVLTNAKHGKQDKTGMRADRELINQFALVADQLVKLCNYAPKTQAKNGRPPRTFSLMKTFPDLAALMPTRVMIPVQKSLTATLPPAGTNPTDHRPFPPGTATLFELGDAVSVLPSLQRPKKLTMLGSDREKYAFLCKPKDDLRKDLRMMEFTTMLNRLLARDAESRKRRLYLRTFSVIPLTEDCGIIEWVPNTTGFRHIIQGLYADDGLYHKNSHTEVKELYEKCKGRNPTSWSREVLSRHPPVFHRWFLERWKEPAAWFTARTAFAHTAAVWSMVGHVVGLGDRHGENILFDCKTGDAVHVDFACLFDKGLELEMPERVPFRLTQNLVDGLGVGGYEGVFMRVCEITLTVLRSHREALMSVLETFVHDPLVEWTKSSTRDASRGGRSTSSSTRGKDALEKIRSRLEGVVVGVGAAPSLPLSPSGQARRLVEEAVSLSNLGSMYIWWMAWH